jgi:hypothetical protein
MGKPTNKLAAWTPTFEIDDGFRLTIEPTLDAVINDVHHWYNYSLRGADMHLLGVFLCGVSMLRARDMVPKASRGATKKSGPYDGFDAWKRSTFGTIPESTLGNYMRFAENVFLHSKDLGKTPTDGFLPTSYKNFTLPNTREGISELLRAIGEVMDGKTMTIMYRAIGRVREALPYGEERTGTDKGHRRTKQAIELEHTRAESAVWFDSVKSLLLEGQTNARWLGLERPALDELSLLLKDLRSALDQFRSTKHH